MIDVVCHSDEGVYRANRNGTYTALMVTCKSILRKLAPATPTGPSSDTYVRNNASVRCSLSPRMPRRPRRYSSWSATTRTSSAGNSTRRCAGPAASIFRNLLLAMQPAWSGAFTASAASSAPSLPAAAKRTDSVSHAGHTPHLLQGFADGARKRGARHHLPVWQAV